MKEFTKEFITVKGNRFMMNIDEAFIDYFTESKNIVTIKYRKLFYRGYISENTEIINQILTNN